MNNQKNIELLCTLGDHLIAPSAEMDHIKELAFQQNAWFTPENIDLAINNIVSSYLQKQALGSWLGQYRVNTLKKTVGIVMAGNLPMVGFHDLLCGFVSGHNIRIKTSSKDHVLISHCVDKLHEWDHTTVERIQIAEQLKNCDAYIATGNNNSARYFEQYFGKYPHIIRKNRTSVAILSGDESAESLKLLADDVFQFYGLGCRNVTQLLVPEHYNFEPLLNAFKKYDWLIDKHKYKNNFDYHLAIYLLNRVPYMTNDSCLLVENDQPFSAVSVVHYRYYTDRQEAIAALKTNEAIQAIVGDGLLPFGSSQQPRLNDYADGIDTMQFLSELS